MKANTLFQLHPLVPLALCLVFGIMAGRWLSPYVTGVVVWLVAVLLSLLLCVLLRKYPVAQSCFLLLTSFLIGGALISVEESNSRISFPEGAVSYEAVVSSEPVERGKTLRFDMIVASGPFCGRTIRASLLRDTVTHRYKDIGVGTGLKAYSEMQPPVNFRNSNFDYVAYMKARGIVGHTFIYYSNWQKAAVNLAHLTFWQRLRLSCLRHRHDLLERYRSLGLSGQGFAITAAMTLGHKSDIPSELRDIYSAAGVSHVLALSGMHLSVIYILLSFLFAGRRFPLLRETLLLTSVWTYVFIVGLPLSVVRAAVMITVYSFVGITGRSRMSLNVLAFAAILMLVACPFCLYDVGFQLSYLAVAAILILHRPLGGLISPKFQQRHPFVRWLWQLVVMSCSAQLATAPLVAYYFGTVPVYFLLSNLVAIPAVTIILYLTVIMLALFFVPAFQQMVATLLMLVATSLNMFLLWVASLPGSSISGIYISAVQLLLIYVVIISLCLLCRILLLSHKR